MPLVRHSVPDRVVCPCGETCRRATGAEVYPRRPELSSERLYVCPACGARVGCHRGTWAPKGFPASEALRRARKAAHAVFDPLWEEKMRRHRVSKAAARKLAYRWLSEQTGIPFKDCHIGMMNEAQCASVVKVCTPHFEALNRRR